eukprot:6869518-Prymnesium_polylepis.1
MARRRPAASAGGCSARCRAVPARARQHTRRATFPVCWRRATCPNGRWPRVAPGGGVGRYAAL